MASIVGFILSNLAQVIKNRIVKAILWTILSLFLLLAILAGAVQFPYIQIKLVNYFSERYSELTGYSISIDHIAIDWFDKVEVQGLKVIDPENNRLLNAEEVHIDFNINGLLNKNNHNIDDITVDRADIYLTKITVDDSIQTLNINELIRRIKAQIRKQTKKRQYLSADHLSLKDASFTFYDPQKDSIKEGFDYFHFTLNNINGEFDQLHSVSDTLDLQVESLTLNESSSHLDVKHFESHFRVSQSALEFTGLNAKVGNSTLRDTVIFKYKNTRDLNEFNTKVNVKAHLNQTTLHSLDLALFAPALKNIDEYYHLSGDFSGKVSSFVFSNANLKFGEGTALKGMIRMNGLPNFSETFINCDLTNSYVRISDLRYYVKKKTYARLSPFDRISFNADFLGFPNDFVANGDFFTDYGRITSDINLKLEDDINKSAYSGSLIMQDFDIGGYSNNKLIQKVTLKGEIKGTGFTLEDANFDLKGHVDQVGINNYDYANIQTDAHFTKEFFEGFINIDDPNLKLATTGSIDLRKGINIFNVVMDLDTANLKPLNLSKEDIFIQSNVNVNARGLELDSIIGIANLNNSLVRYKGQSLAIDSLQIVSEKKNNIRQLQLETNLVNIKFDGDFDYTVVYNDFKKLLFEYKLNLQNDKNAIAKYYAQKDIGNYEDYNVNYTILVKDANPILELFSQDLYISPQSFITGSFTGGYTSIASINTQVDTLTYKNDQLVNSEVQMNISKIADSTNVLAMVYFNSENQNISNIDTRNMILEGIWNNKHIDFEFDIEQIKYTNYASLFGSIDFLPDETQILFQPSDLHILDEKWKIDENNHVTLIGDEIIFKNLKIYNGSQSIALNGQISKDPDKELILNVDSVQLQSLNTILSKDLAGTVQGYSNIKNYYNNLRVESNLLVTNFKIDQFLIGDIEGNNSWNNKKKQFDVNFLVKNQSNNILSIRGNYSPDVEENQLNLNANLNKTQLKVLEPFVDNYFSAIKGTATGKLAIKGNISSPLLEGKGILQNGAVHVNYLNTDYQLQGDFYFKDNKIGFNEVAVKDSHDQNGILSGEVTHQNFRDFFIDIKGQLSNFMVLNTSSNDNNLFYGTGIATGSINFLGPINNMNIIAQATTERGTRIYIPIGDSDNIEREEYIHFVNFNDSTDVDEITDIGQIDLKGLKLDFDLNITPDAYCEIIFDIKSGDIIRGRGNGDIKLQIDTKGDFNMFGDYNIQEGGYNFTLYSIINKEFEILPDSKISWYGDPYQGIIDIKATYNQLASFLPLLVQQETDKVYEDVVEIKRKYPVKVFLDIDGPLLSPTVNFDILSTNLPRNIKVAERPDVDLEFEFLKFKNSIDEQELKRQVFSLIVLRRFSPLQSFNTGGSISSSVSELLSNQLSYWITQVDENLEIDFDVDFDKLDEEAYNTFQLRLSYTLLDGRLRVTRDGSFTNQENKADISSAVGDWTLEYLLTPDGKFKAKMYNRTNYNPINPNDENRNTITTGFSIIHTQSFDEIKELFKRKEKKDKSNKEDIEEEDDGTTIPEATSDNIKPEGIRDEDDSMQ